MLKIGSHTNEFKTAFLLQLESVACERKHHNSILYVFEEVEMPNYHCPHFSLLVVSNQVFFHIYYHFEPQSNLNLMLYRGFF